MRVLIRKALEVTRFQCWASNAAAYPGRVSVFAADADADADADAEIIIGSDIAASNLAANNHRVGIAAADLCHGRQQL